MVLNLGIALTGRARSLRYLLVGGLNVVFTLVVFAILDWQFSAVIGVQAVYWISALLGIANGFVWQRLLVWRSRNQWHAEFLRFLLLNVSASILNSILLLIAVDVLRLRALPSQVVLTGVFVVVSFLVSRNWVFRSRAVPEAPSSDGMPRDRRVDVFLQYYRPHVSGLTNAAADLAEYAARRDFDVHVHCVAQNGQAGQTQLNGVTVHAYRRSFALGRGVFSIALIRAVWKMRHRSGIAHAHMPYPESFLLAWILGANWQLLATYQCDAPRTGGAANLIAWALDRSQTAFIRRAAFTVASSEDYARSSRLATAMERAGGFAIPPPSVDRAGGHATFALPGKRYLGFLGRPTSEKGIDMLMDALSFLPDDVALLMAGPTADLSEKATFDQRTFAELTRAGRIRSLGFLDERQIADFYASLSVFVLPSTNSFEAFGIVQVEAISAGTPVVASDLPGVRTIVESTGFGEIAAIGDPEDLAGRIMAALNPSYDADRARTVLETKYLSPVPEDEYLALYRQLQV